MAQNQRQYDDEFKKRAVQLSYSSDRTVKSVAESLGVRTNLIYRWRKMYTPEGDKTKMADQNDEIQVLRTRIAELEEENDILKKASAYFAKNQR
ncbi:MAG: transposase [Eubacteriales bacterium]|nr:transposase [Eubacteriales bacterium]